VIRLKAKLFKKIILYMLLLAGVLVILFPMYLTIITALKTTEETTKSFFAFPKSFYLGNFSEVIHSSKYFSYVFNSVIITSVSAFIIGIFVPLTAYPLARKMADKKYFKFLYYYIVMGVFIPFQVIMVPAVKNLSRMHLLNRTGLIMMYVTMALCQGIFLCVSYIKSLPKELEEAAKIDGCNTVQTFFLIVFPLMKPMTSTVVILNSLWIWNDFLMPLLVLNKSKASWTLPLFQYNFKSEYTFNYSLAFASFLLAMLPIIILYAFIQRYIISGITNGAVKN